MTKIHHLLISLKSKMTPPPVYHPQLFKIKVLYLAHAARISEVQNHVSQHLHDLSIQLLSADCARAAMFRQTDGSTTCLSKF